MPKSIFVPAAVSKLHREFDEYIGFFRSTGKKPSRLTVTNHQFRILRNFEVRKARAIAGRDPTQPVEVPPYKGCEIVSCD